MAKEENKYPKLWPINTPEEIARLKKEFDTPVPEQYTKAGTESETKLNKKRLICRITRLGSNQLVKEELQGNAVSANLLETTSGNGEWHALAPSVIDAFARVYHQVDPVKSRNVLLRDDDTASMEPGIVYSLRRAMTFRVEIWDGETGNVRIMNAEDYSAHFKTAEEANAFHKAA